MRSRILPAFFLLASCGGTVSSTNQNTPLLTPALLAASDTQIAVGQTLSFYGGSFLNDKGHVELVFQGTFNHATDPGSDPVSFTVRPNWTSGNQVDWTSVGPFWIPFGNGRTLGTFNGTVTANNVSDVPNGGTASSVPLQISVQTTPSIIIDSFQPVMAQGCPGPVKRILGGYPYQLTVEAIGFTPVNFTYYQVSPTFTPPPLRHPAQGQTDTFGQNNELYFPPVADQQTFYVTEFTISALGTDGNTYGVTYSFGVHKPIEYVPTGPAQVAEYEQPVAIGGCIPGNLYGGQMVDYMDSNTEEKSRNVGYSWDQSWQQTMDQQKTTGQTVHNGVNLSVSNSSNSDWSAGWNVGQDSSQSTSNGWSQDYGSSNQNTTGQGTNTGTQNTVSVNGEFDPTVLGIGLGQVGAGYGNTTSTGSEMNSSNSIGQNYNTGSNSSVQNSMSKQVGLNGNQQVGSSVSTTVGADHSQDDTESWALSQSNGYTVSGGSNWSWQVSSSSSTTVGTSYQLLPGYDGMWYRQTTRLAYPGQLISYDLCSQPTPAANAYFYDYVWAVALGIGNSCATNGIPVPSSFPSAQCFIGCNPGN